jgi:hypothetical protein
MVIADELYVRLDSFCARNGDGSQDRSSMNHQQREAVRECEKALKAIEEATT